MHLIVICQFIIPGIDRMYVWLVLEIPFLDNEESSAHSCFGGVWLVFVVRLNSLHGGLFPAVVYASFFTESLILAQDERWRRA